MRHSETGNGRAGAIVVLVVLTIVLVFALGYFMDRGPTEIDVSGLERAARAVKESTEDASVTAKVKTAFALSKSVAALEIDIDTRDGRVTLTGEAPSARAKAHAGRLALDTSGVEAVDNQLLVVGASKPEPGVSDEALADLELKATIYERLFRAPDLLGRDFTVSVENGKVTLTGLVPSESDRVRAQEITTAVAGVVSVDNQLRVSS